MSNPLDNNIEDCHIKIMPTKKTKKTSTKTRSVKSSPSKSKTYGYKYGKRPLWQWIVIYVILGVIVYGLVYYVIVGNKRGQNYSSPQPSSSQSSPYNTQ